jgi:uncharacterized protein YbaR (Trm112 family)
MDPKLLDILACPKCKQALVRGKGDHYLICESEGLAYPIIDGIPYLLESKAVKIAEISTAEMSHDA